MSFNDLAKKEAAEKKASQEKDPKSDAQNEPMPVSKSISTDPSEG